MYCTVSQYREKWKSWKRQKRLEESRENRGQQCIEYIHAKW